MGTGPSSSMPSSIMPPGSRRPPPRSSLARLPVGGAQSDGIRDSRYRTRYSPPSNVAGPRGSPMRLALSVLFIVEQITDVAITAPPFPGGKQAPRLAASDYRGPDA